MWLPPLLRPLCAVAFDTVLALLRALPGANLLESSNRPRDGIPVFVMMPLDFVTDNPVIPAAEIPQALAALTRAGVHGIMVDVWWGICEPRPREYDFSLYARLFETCAGLGLKVQAVMAFHACGGNVGDFVKIPLPSWVEAAADKHRAWFTDRVRAVSGDGFVNREYLSFATDHHAFLPTGMAAEREGTAGSPAAEVKGAADTAAKASGTEKNDTEISKSTDRGSADLRTPMQAYAEFIEAFCKYMSGGANSYLESTITELQIGVGPCGELRYPGYPMAEDKWKFPGIGEFQCYDPHLLKSLAQAASEYADPGPPADLARWSVPPDGMGSYNDTPFATSFFTRDFRTAHGKFFQKWYSRELLRHGDDMLTRVRAILPKGGKSVALAMKISGIHWWYFTRARAAEATSGYYVSREFNFYEEAVKLFKKHDVVFDFTCLEMKTINQPFLAARCGPKQLVREVFRIAAEHDVIVAGENALERYDWPAYEQVLRAFKWTRARPHGFTLLRLTPALLEEVHMVNLERMCREMRLAKGK